jgi:LysR family transcriptional regulator for metE and metH
LSNHYFSVVLQAMVELKHLRLVKEIVEKGGITKASDSLFLTQSAVSHQLKEIEFQLGCQLFLRRNKQLHLTAIGEKVYQLALEVLPKVEACLFEVNQVIKGYEGTIRIAAECYTGYHWLPSLIRGFSSSFPKVTIQLLVEATKNPIGHLKTGNLDLAIISGPMETEDIHSELLFEDELVLLSNKDHWWANKAFLEPQDFKEQHLFIHSLPLESVIVIRDFLSPAQITPESVTPLPLTEAAIELVKSGFGVMTLPSWTADKYLDDHYLITHRLGPNGLFRKHYACYMKTDSFAPVLKELTILLHQTINK